VAFDEALGIRIRDVLDAREFSKRDIDERRMFGGLAFLDRGRMFIGITGDDLMVRVGPERGGEALARPHVRPMDFTGKPMVGYVYVSAPAIPTAAALREWVSWSLEFVDTLPVKTPGAKPPATKKAAKKQAARK
jgi:TfoX/Sxy family transcriptional regulator of competence genes